MEELALLVNKLCKEADEYLRATPPLQQYQDLAVNSCAKNVLWLSGVEAPEPEHVREIASFLSADIASKDLSNNMRLARHEIRTMMREIGLFSSDVCLPRGNTPRQWQERLRSEFESSSP